MSELQEEMLRRGAARPGQVLPHQLLQMPCMPEFSGPGRVLLQRRRLLLHQRLPGPFRHQMLSLRTVRRGGSGHRSGEDVPQQLFHLRPLQVIAVFFVVNQPAEKELFFTTTTTTTTQTPSLDVHVWRFRLNAPIGVFDWTQHTSFFFFSFSIARHYLSLLRYSLLWLLRGSS